MSIPHPVIVSILVLALALPIASWVASRVSRALRQRDAALERAERERITASVGDDNAGDDFAAQILMLMDREALLVRSILRERDAGGQVSQEQLAALRHIHREGLALRRQCGDPMLDAELSWFQGLGSLALMADLSELDLAHFDHELDYRTTEVRRALLLQSRPADNRPPDPHTAMGMTLSDRRQANGNRQT